MRPRRTLFWTLLAIWLLLLIGLIAMSLGSTPASR
jgi:hypothetical protein